jgi:hypothetical protein
MSARKRKRLRMRRTVPVFSCLLRHGLRVQLKRVRGGWTNAEPIVFPPPGGEWGTVTHAWGPFVPLPIRAHVRKRDRWIERKWGRIARATRLLTIREE